MSDIIYTRHPEYNATEMCVWRLAYEGGPEFIRKYLHRHSQEIEEVWRDRRALTYNPAFAKEAINEFVRAINQRMEDVRRVGGPESYLEACEGRLGGVDTLSHSMNAFMGIEVVGELLAMGRVGVFIDNHKIDGPTLADVKGHPYLYTYKSEDILNWAYDDQDSKQLQAVLLRDYKQVKSEDHKLPTGVEEYYRYLYIGDHGHVEVEIYNNQGKLTSTDTLEITEIPFVIMELRQSLLKDVADYQIALLNLASSDFFYCWASNFPVYTEQYNPMTLERFAELRENDNPPDPNAPTNPADIHPATDTKNRKPDTSEAQIGVLTGRRYPMGTERPGFIHPSPEPMLAAMSKEKQLRQEIRELVQLAITNLEPTRVSAESKDKDQESGVESGLSQIGRVCNGGEDRIAQVWALYKNSSSYTYTKYPEKYSLKSDEDRRRDSEELQKLQNAVPSPTFQREVGVEIVRAMFDGKRTAAEVIKMEAEVKKSDVPTADPEILRSDNEAGFVSDKTASEGRGYAPGEAKQAAIDHAKRLARIKMAQSATKEDSGARGVVDEDGTPNKNAKDEKTQSQDGNEDKGGRGDAAVYK